MKQRGRQSAKSKETAGNVVDLGSVVRPHAPDDLTDTEKALFDAIVAPRPAEYFDAATIPMLAEYCSIPSEMALISKSLRQFQPEWLNTDEGLKRFKELSNLKDKGQKRMALLATKMRLAQQSRYISDSRKAKPKPAGNGPRPWEG